jgi:hypothetical protein
MGNSASMSETRNRDQDPEIKARPQVSWRRFFLKTLSVFVAISFLLDPSYCFIGACLTKQSAFAQVQLGMGRRQVEDILLHAGIRVVFGSGGDGDV